MIGAVAVLLPFLLMALVSQQCTQLLEEGKRCEENPAMAETVQQVTTAAFAWLATPPR
jgi:hypothetical protein